MATTYNITPDSCTVTFDTDMEMPISEQIGRYDGVWLVPAGTYPITPVTIDYKTTSIDDAYYFHAKLPSTLLRGGYPDETAGITTRTISFVPYGYEVRKHAAETK